MKRISKGVVGIAAAIVVFVPIPSVAQKARCTQSQITRLEDDSDQLRNWSALHSYYLRYKACNLDDADAEEGYSEPVARILVDSWKELPVGAQLMNRDIGFRRFVLSGINITLLVDDLDAIKRNSQYKCPIGQYRLCKDLIAAVQASNQ
jgi:hypothetical protein